MGDGGAHARGPAALACLRTGERLVRLLGVAVEEPVGRSSSGEERLAAEELSQADWAAL